MLKDRSKAGRIYDEAAARRIFERIQGRHAAVLEKNIGLFREYLSDQVMIP